MKPALLSLTYLFFACAPLLAQVIPLDPTFHQLDRGAGIGFNGTLGDLLILENGKHLVGGRFTSYNGQSANGLVRLLPDGQSDPSFSIGSGFQTQSSGDYAVNSIQVQPDGKLLVGGGFIAYKDSEAKRLIRLNPDGSRDPSFQTGTGFDQEVLTIRLQSDGKILVGGRMFTTYNDEPVASLVRINPDGSRDPSFNAEETALSIVREVALQPDGKILVNTGDNFIRLHPDGSRDNTFKLADPFGNTFNDPDYGTYTNTFHVFSVFMEQDGSILLRGDMRRSLKSSVAFLRLNPDGSLDKSFQSYEEEIGFEQVGNLAKSLDGELFTVGLGQIGFDRSIQRLLPDGTLDETFIPAEDFSDEALLLSGTILKVQQDGKFLVNGSIGKRSGLFRINPDGSLDRSYNPIPEFNREVHTLTLQPDGKILAAGNFNRYNGQVANGLARVHPDGTLDETFDSGTGLDYSFYNPQLSIFIQHDNRILLIGNFIAYNDIPAGGIVRLLPDGRQDRSFQPGTGFEAGSELPAILQKDGKIVVAGTLFNGDAFPGLFRLNPDGSKDITFDIGSGFDRSVSCLAAAPGNKILAAGIFTSFNGDPVNLLVRLNPDGSRDHSFNVDMELEIRPENLLVQGDGKILVAGSDGPTGHESRLIRLNPDGSLDTGFKTGIAASERMGPLTLQPDRKILLSLGKYGPPNILARLMPDGSVDPTLKLDYNFNDGIQTMKVDSKGNLLAGGSFTSFNGVNAYRMAKIPDIVDQPAALENIFRINAGGREIWHDSERWLPDTRFSGGGSYSNLVPISNTENDALYQTERNGDFSYEIPVYRKGLYTLELHFAEIHWARSGARLFDIFVENNLFKSNIDLVRENGVKKATIIRIEDLEVNDGNLSLELISQKDRAKISGIALYKQTQNETPEDIRINAGGDALYYLGEEWLSDRYYLGGKTHFDDTNPISATDRDELHHSERYGEFSYRIPVPKAGKYFLVLHLSEIFWEKEGERVFDVFLENEQAKIEKLDLIKLIGEPNHAYMLNAGTVEVMDGIFDLEFIPRVNEAKVSGIRLALVKPDAKAPVITQPLDFTFNEGQQWTYPVKAYSPVEGQNLNYFAVGLPESVNIDPDTGHISGIFRSPGRYEVTLKVTDQQGLAAYADFSITVNPLTVVSRINAGGHSLELGDKGQWHGNLRHPSGRIYSTTSSISNTGLDTIYQSERNGDFSYEIKVPARGYYTVELHFAEIHWNRENARLFRYQLENEPLSEIIDLYKDHGGANHAYIRTIHDVQVKDGYLSLEMITVKDRAKLSGIVVYRQGTLASAARLASEIGMEEAYASSEPANKEEPDATILYPNPARNELNLEFETNEPGVWNFVLINSLGVSTFLDRVSLETGRHRLQFDLSVLHLSAGTYYLRLESEKEKPRVKRVIIY
ncbi:delta-60 repeat domain-containing protein/Por secretion system C-terminal sorting domain-containing protein [Cyclobacterium lianum]|uniref:Delta-60 repeat domain-containing protein/Por secretion system C-terminal sorting domain-containing protein n=1 Tax=Cyclobacterium lianum TaxID=388280 RepID=A0A1M7INQ8_9BACT|nr:malectin domain-containing carbohydrate-binding protein [Cyclobacterium lianum]SHM42017.1 delta-60 repeat domain-containing protein/Por secretion system C-terminal sorting domain-containing protein [Cyclobacterium lianum]